MSDEETADEIISLLERMVKLDERVMKMVAPLQKMVAAVYKGLTSGDDRGTLPLAQKALKHISSMKVIERASNVHYARIRKLLKAWPRDVATWGATRDAVNRTITIDVQNWNRFAGEVRAMRIEMTEVVAALQE